MWSPTEQKLLEALESGRARSINAAVGKCDPWEITNVFQHIVKQQDASAVAALAKITDVNAHADDLNTLLEAAAATGDLQIVTTLVEAGADVDECDRKDFASALSVAAARGDVAIVGYLIDHGATRPAVLAGALHEAIENRHFEIAQQQLSHLPASDRARWKKQLAAAKRKSGPIKTKGLSPTATKAFIKAAEAGDLKPLRDAIAAGVDLNAVRRHDGCTALHCAAANGHAKIVAELLAAGADPSVTDDSCFCPLTRAKDAQTVKALVNGGADPNARNENDVPVSFACRALPEILQAGADPNAHAFGTPLLMHVIERTKERHRRENVQALIAAGADVTIRSESEFEFGRQPIHAAARQHDVKVMKLLIEAGADMAAVDDLGYDALAYFRDYRAGNKSRYERIKKQLARAKLYDLRWDRLALAAQQGDGKRVARLIREDADLNAAGDVIHKFNPDALQHGTLPLAAAAEYGHLDVCRTLIEAGADVNAVTFLTGQPLFAAAAGGNSDIVKLLLEAGADPNSAGPKGEGCALETAASHGHPEIVSLLLFAGADVTPVNLAQVVDRATTYAILTGQPIGESHIAATELLIEAGADVNAQHPESSLGALVYAEGSKSEALFALLKKAGAK